MGTTESNFANFSSAAAAVDFHAVNGRITAAGDILVHSASSTSSTADHYDPANDLMESWGYTAAATVLAVNGFLGFTLNISVIVLMCKDMQLWNPINIILFNLVCSDFAVALLGNPLTMTAAIYHRWIFGPTMCVCYGFFMSLLGIGSIGTLTVLSYERLCTVKYPFTTKQLNNRSAFVLVALIWMYSLAVASPPLFGWGAYVNEAANISCSVNWESQSTNTTTYVLYMFFFGLVVPATIITYSYVTIVLVMRNSSMRLGKRSRNERKVTCMVGVMIAAFMVAWTPYSVFSLVKQFGDPASIGPGMAVLPSLIAKTSICYNPIIYVGMNSQFQHAFNRIFGRGDADGRHSTKHRQRHGGNVSQTTTNCTTSMMMMGMHQMAGAGVAGDIVVNNLAVCGAPIVASILPTPMTTTPTTAIYKPGAAEDTLQTTPMTPVKTKALRKSTASRGQQRSAAAAAASLRQWNRMIRLRQINEMVGAAANSIKPTATTTTTTTTSTTTSEDAAVTSSACGSGDLVSAPAGQRRKTTTRVAFEMMVTLKEDENNVTTVDWQTTAGDCTAIV